MQTIHASGLCFVATGLGRDGLRRASDPAWQRLSAHFDTAQLIDVVFPPVGCYDLLAMPFKSFGVQPKPGVAPLPSDLRTRLHDHADR